MKSFIKKHYKFLLIFLGIFVVVSVSTGLLIGSLVNYTNENNHDERSNYLTGQTETSVSLIDKELDKYVTYSTAQTTAVEKSITPDTNIYTYIESIKSTFYYTECRFIFVDTQYNWYGINYKSGIIQGPEYYSPASDKSLIYLVRGDDSQIESFCFKTRFSTPIQMTDGSKKIIINNLTVIIDLDQFFVQISAAFPYDCNKAIFDKDGTILYKEYDGGILSGSNLYDNYINNSFLYNVNGFTLVTDIVNGAPAVAEYSSSNKNYFICSQRFSTNNWGLSFVVASSSLQMTNYSSTMTWYFIGITLILLLALAGIFISIIINYKNKSRLELEIKENEIKEQKNKDKQEFISNISHDIRTPINGIMGMTKLATNEENNPKTLEYLRKIDVASHHLSDLVNDVLDISTIESGKVKVNMITVNINEILRKCDSIGIGYALDRKLNISAEIDHLDNPYIITDDVKLRQIIINLFSNAIKYTDDDGSITLRMKKLNEDKATITLSFEVEDTGIGMSEEFLEVAFDPFSQESINKARTEYKGSGLGLSIVKKYVELLHGTIKVTSKINEGSKFVVTFTFKKGLNVNEADKSHSIKGCKVLLAEDNEINIIIAKELLESEGAIVTVAKDGKEALDIFTNNKPKAFDVILMDLMMPRMDGMEATKAIRNLNRKDKDIPIIAMTAKSQESDVEKTKEIGMDGYLTKPINIDSITHEISKFYISKK